MPLTQIQIIQSLGDAMSWFERELAWGVPPAELRHLCGRIGELYAALITNGQMVPDVNQRGYDVVSESVLVTPAKPLLRSLAVELGLSMLNSSGNEYNTRQLGTNVIKAIQSSS